MDLRRRAERTPQIAAFNLALAAWKLIGQYRQLPPLNLACCGLGINSRKEDWVKLAHGDKNLRSGMEQLYDLFQKAPDLGSLINPCSIGGNGGEPLVAEAPELKLVAEFHELQPLLEKALAREETKRDETLAEMGVTARGLAHAAEILAGKFTLVATNVPYLGEKKQDYVLKCFCRVHHNDAKADLATCFIDRCLTFSTNGGTTSIVTPHNWLFLGAYKKLRLRLLATERWDFVAQLGARAFETISGEIVNVALVSITAEVPSRDHAFTGLDVAGEDAPGDKDAALQTGQVQQLSQEGQVKNPDARVVLEPPTTTSRLSSFAISMRGIVSGDTDYWMRVFWELAGVLKPWRCLQSTIRHTEPFSGREHIIDWRTCGKGMLRPGTENEAYG